MTNPQLTPCTARFHLLKWGAAFGVSLALTACGGGDDAMTTESTGPVLQRQGVFDARIKGAWRVLGEGRLIEVGDQEIQQFQETKSICYADRQVLPAIVLEGYSYRRVEAAGKVTVDLYATAGAPSGYTLEAIPMIPADCRKTPPTDGATVFKTMWDMFDLDYGFFKERNIDWPARHASLQPKAAAAADGDALQAVLAEAIRDFNDAHVSLIRFQGDQPVFQIDAANGPTLALLRRAFAEQSETASFDAFEAQWRQSLQGAVSRRLTGGSHGRVLNGAMVWGSLPGNIGYIELSRMADFSEQARTASDLELIRAEIDRAIAALAGTRALIFDIAVNDGGYDVVGAEVAGRFADSRRPAFHVRQHRPEGRPDQQWFVEPKGPLQYLKPVYLLTTDRTVSAGDSLALMMRQLPHVTLVGQPTSGSISNKLVKSLPGDFMVTFSNESYVDPQGVLYEGRGVPPDVPLQVFKPLEPASLYTGHGAAIDRVMGLVADGEHVEKSPAAR
jgi:carboxyl-terminal processing protease